MNQFSTNAWIVDHGPVRLHRNEPQDIVPPPPPRSRVRRKYDAFKTMASRAATNFKSHIGKTDIKTRAMRSQPAQGQPRRKFTSYGAGIGGGDGGGGDIFINPFGSTISPSRDFSGGNMTMGSEYKANTNRRDGGGGRRPSKPNVSDHEDTFDTYDKLDNNDDFGDDGDDFGNSDDHYSSSSRQHESSMSDFVKSKMGIATTRKQPRNHNPYQPVSRQHPGHRGGRDRRPSRADRDSLLDDSLDSDELYDPDGDDDYEYEAKPAANFVASEVTTNYDALYYLAKTRRFPMFSSMWRFYQNKHGQGDILHQACKKGHTEMVTALVERSVDVNLLDNNDTTALYHAIEHDHTECARILINNGAVAEITEKIEPGKSLLHTAARKGNLEVCRLLVKVDRWVDVNAQGEFDYTPLHVAADAGFGEIVSFLLESGAKIDALTKSDRTAFEIAMHNNKLDIAKLFLEKGANIERFDDYGRSILHWAAGSSTPSILSFLLDNSASPRLANKEGMLPHHVAARSGRASNLHILLARGAPLDAARSTGSGSSATLQTALEDAMDAKKYACVAILLMHGAKTSPSATSTSSPGGGFVNTAVYSKSSMFDSQGTLGSGAGTHSAQTDPAAQLLLRLANTLAHEPSHFGGQLIEAFLYSGHINGNSLNNIIRAVYKKMNLYADLEAWYRQLLPRPPSLKNLSRVRVRNSLLERSFGTSIMADIYRLDQLPVPLKDFVMMKECDLQGVVESVELYGGYSDKNNNYNNGASSGTSKINEPYISTL